MGNKSSSSQEKNEHKPTLMILHKSPSPLSTERLSVIRQQIIELKRRHEDDVRDRDDLVVFWGRQPNERYETKDHWGQSHLSALLEYLSKLEGINYKEWDHIFGPRDPTFRAQTVESLTQDILDLFNVPNLDTLEKNQLVATFINFLLGLTKYRTDSIRAFGEQFESFRNELRYLVTILGDKMFLHTELKDVEDMLVEFEVVANHAGSLVHSFIFTRDPLLKFETPKKFLNTLLRRIKLLKANIIRFSKRKELIIEVASGMTPNATSVDSLFIINSLLYDLEDLLSRDDCLVVDMKQEIRILYEELMLSQSLLKGIMVPLRLEVQQLDERVLRLIDGAYEAEYLINYFLVGDIPPWYFSVRLPHLVYKIRLIRTGLQEIKNNYDVRDSKIAKSPSLQAKRSSEVDDVVVGFEDKAIDILDQLVGGTERLQIVSIFGMPGLGKTTFAKRLYNHPLVNYRFDKCSWCVVSQTYQRKSLLIDILMSSTNELDRDGILNMREESLVERVYKSFKGKRYLIVLDDIWKPNVWNDLLRTFPDDGNGSRILFTSRHKDTAPPNSTVYALPSLSNDQCWELLEKKVFHNEPCPPNLLRTGKKIAAKCNGLPLAVVVVAGMLSTVKKDERIWKKVGGNLASYIFEERNNPMIQILDLSYKHLPEHLKPCFLYFGAFLKYKEVPARKLMMLWVAEGFIHKDQEKDAESVAEEYLTDLIDRSLVMISKKRSDGGVKACVMHDLWRELCSRIAEKENFVKIVDNYSIYEKHQRLCVESSEYLTDHLPPVALHVRSFIGSRFHPLNMKLVRVLDLGASPPYRHIDTDSFKFLLQLRYLAIGYISVKSISSLLKLEYLILKGQVQILDLSPLITKMLKLRYVLVTPGATYDVFCHTLPTNNLEYISLVVIRNQKEMEMLKCSPRLRKLKCLCKLKYGYPDFRFLAQLESLNITMELGYMNTYYGTKGVADIRLPSSIKKLTLSKTHLPWEKMSIIGGLPNLQVLKLLKSAFVGEMWETRDGEFNELRLLKMEWLGMSQWNVGSGQHFPKLQRLTCRRCLFLEQISCVMGEIMTLQSIEVESCSKTVAESALQIQQEQRDLGNEELRVVIR